MSETAHLQDSGSWAITIEATGYQDNTATEDVGFGAAANVDASAQPDTLDNGGAETSVITAVVTDQYGNFVEGVVVDFSVTTGNGSLSDANVTTDAQGQAQSTYTTTAADDNSTVTITAEEQDNNNTDTADITVAAP